MLFIPKAYLCLHQRGVEVFSGLGSNRQCEHESSLKDNQKRPDQYDDPHEEASEVSIE